ncbi:uncharacterized protein [Macrobrachium rosenbergii]|uniref:uncharacterized protein isoform X1 n=1 Tax=Macrobrachium rosenbergii TaxID=79674 RepID=UPI0034D72522
MKAQFPTDFTGAKGEMPSLECGVCLELYNESSHIPRCLSCNHVLCTSCIIQLLRKGPLKCPFCRSWHGRTVISSVDIPVHNRLMSMVSENLKRNSALNDGEGAQSDQETHLNVVQLRADILRASEEGTNVYAQLLRNDRQARHARVSICDNRLHLHCLKDEPPLHDSRVISYDMVRALADEVYSVVFLEITWNAAVQGKVYIHLLDDAGRTRQFLYLCTGEQGPSYANTRFLEVSNKGNPGEQVWGGDYENNDGSGGAALPDMVRGPKNHQDVIAGLVAGFYYPGFGQDHNPSQFGIYTRDMAGYVEMSSMGRVLSGLEIMTAVAQLVDLQDAFVSDCGLVLFH